MFVDSQDIKNIIPEIKKMSYKSAEYLKELVG